MRHEIFLPEPLSNLLGVKAEEAGLTLPAYITGILEEKFASELPNISAKSYMELFDELKSAVLAYINKQDTGKQFTLRDVPYYVELGLDSNEGGSSLPATLRARLARSLNKEMIKTGSPQFAHVVRAKNKKGKPAYRNGAAVYEII